MKPTYTRSQAMRLIPLLEGIVREVHERRQAIRTTEELIHALTISSSVHGDEVRRKRAQLARQRLELKRVGNELAALGCSLTLTDPFEIYIPGDDEGYGWRPGETFLRHASIEPFAA